jgi:hypothetical protein
MATAGPVCDESREYESLEGLEQDAPSMSAWCRSIYSLDVISKMLGKAVDNFNKLDKGYDELFKKYNTAFHTYMERKLAEFMYAQPLGEARKYFTCTFNKEPPRRCDEVHPPDGSNWNLDYHLDDSEGFYKELFDKTGINETWVYFKDKDQNTLSMSTIMNKTTGMQRPVNQWSFNVPRMKSKYDVPNPRTY